MYSPCQHYAPCYGSPKMPKNAKIIRGELNDKPNSGAVRLMATKGDEITLYVTTKLLSWPHESGSVVTYRVKMLA